jgi:hypothetical protein
VLFHVPATKGIEYMTPEEFYTALDEGQIDELRRAKKPTKGVDQWKEKMARVGFKHEDRWLSKQLHAHNRARYLVFRFAYVGRTVIRSLVNGDAIEWQPPP